MSSNNKVFYNGKWYNRVDVEDAIRENTDKLNEESLEYFKTIGNMLDKANRAIDEENKNPTDKRLKANRERQREQKQYEIVDGVYQEVKADAREL
ncbi:MAG: hypothetical protein RR334_00735 [Clostridia bacterium]